MKKPLSNKQQGEEWHAWRAKGIGASEAPAVLGECDFTTRLQLWERKTGRTKPEKTNWAMQRGIDAERRIRALYELRTGIDADPVLGYHDEYPFMRASFDGLNEGASRVIEFKYPSQEKHEIAKCGGVPKTYHAQLQHQLFVSGAETVDYVSYDGKSIIIVSVKPDYKFMERLLKECTEFWALVQTDTPPELSTKDYKVIKSKKLLDLAELYIKIDEVIKVNEKDLKAVKAEIFKSVNDRRFICGPISGITSTRKGSVNYKIIPELKGVDLEQYRKPSSTTQTITKKK